MKPETRPLDRVNPGPGLITMVWYCLEIKMTCLTLLSCKTSNQDCPENIFILCLCCFLFHHSFIFCGDGNILEAWQWIRAYISETKDVESSNNLNSAITWQNFNAFKSSHSQVAKRNHAWNGIRKTPAQVVFSKITAMCKYRMNTIKQ